jgi:exodeoxyribonuclease VII large subunit
VIIVGRGGGSLEDLLPFSSEMVVRAIAASPVPVISAVGHETDVTLSDLAADVRAPTPSAAAEMVAASTTELLGQVAGLASVIQGALEGRLERVRLLLGQFTPQTLQRNIRLLLQPSLQRLDDAREGMSMGFQGKLAEVRHRYELASREVESCSPLAVLQRGYAVVTHGATRKVLLSAQGVRAGDGLDIRLAQGRISATVEETHADEKL